MAITSLKTASEQQFNFAQYLNTQINPIDTNGSASKSRPSLQNPNMMRIWLEILSSKILNIIDEFPRSNDYSEAQKLIQENKITEGLNRCSAYFVKKTDDICKETILHGASSQKNDFFLSFLGGLQNALQLHFGLVKLGVVKSTQAPIGELLTNLKHITSQLSRVHGLTLKLIYNLNGFNANQNGPYEFKENNFEICNYNNSGPYLLPAQEFLDSIIKEANKPNKIVFSSSSLDNQTFRESFAQNYSQVEGCPIHGASSQTISSNSQTRNNLFAEYFEKLSKITLGLFENIQQ
jgi:hypothetical protein